MSQKTNTQNQDMLNWDFSYIFRCLWKNIFVIVMCAIIVGISSYVLLDQVMDDSYVATMTLAVIGRDNVNSRYSENNVNTAVTRNVSVLNSDMLKEQISKREDTADLSPQIQASRVSTSNLISLTATSDSAEHAFRVLKAALDSYPTLASYFESGFVVKNLNNLEVEEIEVQKAKTVYYAAMAAFLVLAGGIALTVYISLVTDKIHNLSQAQDSLDMPMLGSISEIRKKKGQKAILITDDRTDIFFLEDIDKITTRIQHVMDENGYKTVLVSSMSENEGKSTVSANVALNLARRGKRVMLIDSDMRRPAIAKVFDMEIEDGSSLSDYFAGNATFSKVMHVHKDSFGLFTILQKNPIADPDKILENDKYSLFMKMIGCKMDYVVIDTPPTGIVRDAELIAGSADAAVFVLRQDMVHAPVINDIIDVMEDAGTAVIGGVLNRVSGERKGSSGRKYGYGYYGKK
jgi:capsular exopolysaccharide synthesis family protein